MSNKQLPADTRKSWEYKEYFHQTGGDDWDGHYEVTNGDISLCTTDDPDDITANENTLHVVATALNLSGCKFYVNTATEHALHIENMELRGVLEDLARQKLYGEPVDEYDHMYGYEETVKLAREALKRKPKDILGATAVHERAQAEIDRRNKLLEDDLKRQCRLNMPGISEQDQEAAWQSFKTKHNL